MRLEIVRLPLHSVHAHLLQLHCDIDSSSLNAVDLFLLRTLSIFYIGARSSKAGQGETRQLEDHPAERNTRHW